jgi:2-polyprenyl-3-methyl-5-hydroxy-6-metoxy-1,4-benzoquinol methylase
MSKPCIVCNSAAHKKTIWGGYYFKGQRYAIARCANCGFMFLNPLPCKAVLNGIYNGDDYFDNYYAGSKGVKNYIEGIPDRRAQHLPIIDVIKHFKIKGRLLDVGCAAGGFLIDARDSGYEVFGIEPSRKMAGHAMENIGLDVRCGTLEEADFKGKGFDIIYAGDVLEHILELEKDIEIIKRLLADNGIFVINQPLTYNKSLYNLFLQLNMLFKKDRFAQNPPSHLWEFNAATLSRFLKKSGFEIIYYKISETVAKPLIIYEKPGIKNAIGHHIKNFSSAVSNAAMLKRLDLGDRALAVCRKR